MVVDRTPGIYTDNITIRLTPLQKKRLLAISERIGISYSDYLRLLIDSKYDLYLDICYLKGEDIIEI